MRRLLVLLLAVLASVAAAEVPRRSLAAQEAVQSPVPVPDAEKAKALGVDLEAEAVQEAVEQQSAYDAELYSQQHNAAATSALFVGALIGGSAVYCVMKASGAGGAVSGGHKAVAVAPEGDDLKQRLNRLKAMQAATQ